MSPSLVLLIAIPHFAYALSLDITLTDDEGAWSHHVSESWVQTVIDTGTMPGPILVMVGSPPIPVPDIQGLYSTESWHKLLDAAHNPTRIAVALLGSPNIITETTDQYVLRWERGCLIAPSGQQFAVTAIIAKTYKTTVWEFPLYVHDKERQPAID